MALHEFVCDECKIIVEDSNTKEIHKCPGCGEDMRWNFNIAIHGHYDRPVHSDSLAINPCQAEEHHKLFPNIELDKQCRPIFDNFTDHENYLKATGFVKHTKKIKPKGKIIASLKKATVKSN